MKIAGTIIGPEKPCFIVAEVGINHDGNFNQALSLIDVAAKAKCNAVKFQLFTARKMYANNPGRHLVSSGKYVDIYKVVEEAELPLDWIPKLVKHAHNQNLAFVCTTCDEESADILAENKVDAFKIASSELTHSPLLKHVAKKNMPTIISTGASYLAEIEGGLRIFIDAKNKDIAVLHCVAQYPVSPGQLNLRVLTTLQNAFPNTVTGFSDHSSDPIQAPIAAIVLGAKIIEKHITLDRNLPGPDHSFALSPKELTQMVSAIRKTEKQLRKGVTVRINKSLLGSSQRIPYEIEKKKRSFTYRSIFTTQPIKKGAAFNRENIAVLRPGNNSPGLDPWMFDLLVKQHHAVRNIPKNSGLSWNDVLA